MEKVEKSDTGRTKSKCQQKNPNSVALNILITVDKGKKCQDGAAKCCSKCKHKSKGKNKDTCCDDGRNPAVSRCPNPPNSEMLPCGCLIVYDQANNNGPTSCCRSRGSKSRKSCRRGVNNGPDVDGEHCIRVKVKKKAHCDNAAAGCQTVESRIPIRPQEQTDTEPHTRSRSVQAFQSQNYIPPMPTGSHASVKASHHHHQVSITQPSITEVKSPLTHVSPSSKRSSQTLVAQTGSAKRVSTKATQHDINARKSEETVSVAKRKSDHGVHQQEPAHSHGEAETLQQQLPSTKSVSQLHARDMPPSESVCQLEVQNPCGDVPCEVTDVTYEEKAFEEFPPEEECNECELAGECEEDCDCWSSTFKKMDWETWDKFVALLNGEPMCAPNYCFDCPCPDEKVEEQCEEDCWKENNLNGSGCESPGGSTCQAEPTGQETYVLLIALPLVILGILSSFKSKSKC